MSSKHEHGKHDCSTKPIPAAKEEGRSKTITHDSQTVEGAKTPLNVAKPKAGCCGSGR
jgi:hypothetical protein